MRRLLWLPLALSQTILPCLADDPARAAEESALRMKAAAEAVSRQNKATLSAEEREFTERFNKLVDAMRAFHDQYAQNGGAVWPKKQAEALAKAMRHLEATRTWKQFRTTVEEK